MPPEEKARLIVMSNAHSPDEGRGSVRDLPTDPDDAHEWGERFIRFIIPRLAGDAESKEQAMEMILSALERKYIDGIRDARIVVEKVAASTKRESVLAAALVQALKKLEAMNRSSDDGKRLAHTATG